jgi:hypothetical protein
MCISCYCLSCVFIIIVCILSCRCKCWEAWTGVIHKGSRYTPSPWTGSAQVYLQYIDILQAPPRHPPGSSPAHPAPTSRRPRASHSTPPGRPRFPHSSGPPSPGRPDLRNSSSSRRARWACQCRPADPAGPADRRGGSARRRPGTRARRRLAGSARLADLAALSSRWEVSQLFGRFLVNVFWPQEGLHKYYRIYSITWYL